MTSTHNATWHHSIWAVPRIMLRTPVVEGFLESQLNTERQKVCAELNFAAEDAKRNILHFANLDFDPHRHGHTQQHSIPALQRCAM